MPLPYRLSSRQAWKGDASALSARIHTSWRAPQSQQWHLPRPHHPRLQTAPFSTSPILQKRKDNVEKRDPRIALIRYFLFSPKNPRPLRFSRLRYLRHWTIHRAWMLHKRKLREQAQLDLERQYWAMNKACEELRLIGENGLPGGKDEGRLFRIAMRKEGVWQGAPIEYARMQTEWPSKKGWNHEWKRT